MAPDSPTLTETLARPTDPSGDPWESEPPEEDSLLGSMIDGRYRIDARIGQGAMGRVYRAHSLTANRSVAVKVLSVQSDAERRAVFEARFLREARVVSRIAHPNVIDVYDFGVLPEGQLYYVMEFVDGQPLEDLLVPGTPMPLTRILRLAKQIAAGLQAAHAEGVVHRDLKPDNIIVLGEGARETAKVVDFGIAKLLDGQSAKITRAGVVTGTPHYLSPEQARATDVDERSDIYSFGVVLYELAVGELPFDDRGTWVDLVESHLHEIPRPPSDRGAQVGDLEPVIMRCLEKDPAQRFQTIGGLAAALAAVTGAPSAPQPTVRVDRPTPVLPPMPRPRFLSSRAVGGAMIMGLLIAGAGTWAAMAAPARDATGPTAAETVPAPVPAVGTPSAPSTPPSRAMAPALADEAPPEVTVRVSSEPGGAEVFLDGALLGNTPLDIVRPRSGAVPLRVALAGHEAAARVLGPDSPEAMQVQLTPQRSVRRRRSAETAAPEEAVAPSAASRGPDSPGAEEPGSEPPAAEPARREPRPVLEKLVNPWDSPE